MRLYICKVIYTRKNTIYHCSYFNYKHCIIKKNKKTKLNSDPKEKSYMKYFSSHTRDNATDAEGGKYSFIASPLLLPHAASKNRGKTLCVTMTHTQRESLSLSLS